MGIKVGMKKQKPQKIGEISLSVYDDSTVTGKFVVIHKYPDLGTQKEQMPKSEFIQMMSQLVPSVRVAKSIEDLSDNNILALVNY